MLFEDERLLVVDKPAGRLVIPGRAPQVRAPQGRAPQGRGAEDQEPLVLEASRRAGGKVFVVHRLDRETSGALVFAKDAATHARLCALFESHAVAKVYWALAQDRLTGSRVMDQPLAAFGSGRWGVKPGGKPSRTELRPLEDFAGRATLVEARPLTGRRHQVRVHLYAAGHPVLGDRLYGKPGEWSLRAPRLMLHAARISFKLGARRFEASAALPADFEALMKELRA